MSLWNQIKTTSAKVGGGVPVWAVQPERRISGGLLKNTLNVGEKVSAGTPMYYDYATHEAKLLKCWKIKTATVDGANTNLVLYRTFLTPELYAGMNIMVAPLNIDRVVVDQRIHDQMRAGATIKNIADDMQPGDSQPLDQLRQRNHKSSRCAGFDDGADDALAIGALLLVAFRGLQQFFENGGKIPGQQGDEFALQVLRGHRPAHPQQAQ